MEPLTVVASWATPTSLFLLLNVVIGFIAVSSVFNSKKNEHPQQQQEHHQIHHQEQTQTQPQRLVRAPSLFSRVTSFRFCSQSAPETENRSLITPVPSFLSRMTSFNSLYLHRSGESETNHESEANMPESEPEITPPSFISRMTSFKSLNVHRSAESETIPLKEKVDEPVTRLPSLVARMASFNRSINLSLNRSTETEAVEEEHHVTRSATEPKNKKRNSKLPKAGVEMKKSASEKMEGQEKAEAASFGNGEVDAQADDFINRFKQQLRLQRLDSLLRYRNSSGGS